LCVSAYEYIRVCMEGTRAGQRVRADGRISNCWWMKTARTRGCSGYTPSSSRTRRGSPSRRWQAWGSGGKWKGKFNLPCNGQGRGQSPFLGPLVPRGSTMEPSQPARYGISSSLTAVLDADDRSPEPGGQVEGSHAALSRQSAVGCRLPAVGCRSGRTALGSSTRASRVHAHADIRPGPVDRRFTERRSQGCPGFSPQQRLAQPTNQQHQIIIIAMWGISRIAGLAVRQVRQQQPGVRSECSSQPSN